MAIYFSLPDVDNSIHYGWKELTSLPSYGLLAAREVRTLKNEVCQILRCGAQDRALELMIE